MSETYFTLFDTALGRCGLAFGPAGVLAVSFPETNDEATVRRLKRRAPGAVEGDPPPAVASVVAGIVALLAGEKRVFDDAELDMSGIAEFDRAVLGLTLDIKPGETKTYGDIARALGDVSESRRVGQALGRNPFPIVVPCHRVVGASGAMTGFSAPGGTEMKRRLLKIEGALARELFD